MRTRIVRLEAFSKRYKRGAIFLAMPYYDYSIANYVTGQEKNLENPMGLTKRQIEGKDPITAAQRKKYDYIIDMSEEAFRGVPFRHGMKLDLSQESDNANARYINAHDKAIYDFMVTGQRNIVAASESDCKHGKHLFYFLDREKDAEKRVIASRTKFDAIRLVDKHLSENSFYELLLTVNYEKALSYNIDETREYLLIDSINEVCEKHSDIVKKHFSKTGQDNLFILKLRHHKIIEIRDGAFYKDDKFLGSNPQEVIAFANKKTNAFHLGHWRSELAKKDKEFAEILDLEKKNSNQ